MSRRTAGPTPVRRTGRRKVVAVTVVALGVAGLGLASAAQLTLNAGSLGAGTTVVASCDTNGVKVGFTNTFSVAAKGYTVSGVTLTDVADTCAGQTVSVELLDADPAATTAGASLGRAQATVPTGGGTVTLTVTGSPKAADVKGVAAVIAG
ncbi:MAG: hypothetical protein IE923_04525 [Micrococcales bacterium]|nr:hypothetical protein [Micrococcales bacterium]